MNKEDHVLLGSPPARSGQALSLVSTDVAPEPKMEHPIL